MTKAEHLRLFEAHGVEIEYMIVDRRTLDVAPIADRLLVDAAGEVVSDIERGRITWCNELSAQVVELKVTQPEPALEPLPELFQAEVAEIDRRLEPLGARLLPTGLHPWMDPVRETRLWPHGAGEIYRAFDAVFDCRGHGWSNLQSVQLNLPFADDSELVRLHAAIRLLLPLMPALAASTPFVEGAAPGWLDERLRYYAANCRRLPSVTGLVVPEDVSGKAQYEREILGRMFADIAPLDPEGLLREEWLNARGATVRYDRWAIEIRVLDTQECPLMDLAILAAITALVRALVEERWGSLAEQRALDTEELAEIFRAACVGAETTVVRHPGLLRVLGRPAGRAPRIDALWSELLAELWPAGSAPRLRWGPALDVLLGEGSLATRIQRASGKSPSRARLTEVYGALADCLREGRPFRA